MFRLFTAALVAGLSSFASPAFAHVTLEVQQAAVPSTYKAVLRVGHGCGTSPTVKLRVQIPDGVINVKPMPKPGWTLTTTSRRYGKTHEYYGTPLAEGVREIVWSGKLPDDRYDEFVFRAFLTEDLKPGETLYFPVVQECAKGANRWTEIPATGQDAHDLTHPAAGLKLLAKP